MATRGVRTFDQSLEATKRRLPEVQEQVGLDDERRAFRVMPAVLQTLHARLTVEEAARLAAQLPFRQGVCYHGSTQTGRPLKIRSSQELLDRVAEGLLRQHGPAQACCTVFRVRQEKMTSGEIENVKRILPELIRDWWP